MESVEVHSITFLPKETKHKHTPGMVTYKKFILNKKNKKNIAFQPTNVRTFSAIHKK